MQIKSLPILLMVLFFGGTHTYGQTLTTKSVNGGVWVFEDGRHVLFYQFQPKTVNGKYERAGYVHPLFTLKGNILTENNPADHPYHRGIFWAWHQIWLNGEKVADGWMSEHISWQPIKLRTKHSDTSVTINAKLTWEYKPAGDHQEAIARENTKITVFRSSGTYRIIDFDITIKPLRNNLQFGGADDAKGYGGFCLRLKLPPDIQFVSGNRTVKPELTAVTAGPWMDFEGSFDGADQPLSGVALFCGAPKSGSTQKWILRSEKSMQNAVFPGRTPIRLPQNGWHLHYRVIVHSNKVGTEELEQLYKVYLSGINKKGSNTNL